MVAQCDDSKEILSGFEINILDHMFMLIGINAGLTNFISRRSSFSTSKFREKSSQLSVMPSGSIPSDTLVYLSKPRFGEFIKRLGMLFERVVIETPPVNAYGDALVVSKVVDAVVLL